MKTKDSKRLSDGHLGRDQRGAVMLTGLFMSCFLVGVLWYVIGVGDAAVYRQYMQDGSDAAAFAGAVYNARGMNILAMLNLLMAAILAVLVAFKIAQVLLALATAIACAIGAFFDPVCDVLAPLNEPLAQIISDDVQPFVTDTLKVLHTAETVFARAWPLVAEVPGALAAGDYKPTVHGGLIFSTSMIPGEVESAIGGIVTENDGKTIKKPDATRYGLPVQDDDFTNLCKKAGQDVGEIIFLPLGPVGQTVGGLVGNAMGDLASADPSFFCGASGGGGSGAMSSIAKSLGAGSNSQQTQQNVENQCKQTQQNIDNYNKNAQKNGQPTKPPLDLSKCEQQSMNSINTIQNISPAGGGDDESEMALYDIAEMGDDYFAVWSFAWGDLSGQTTAPKGTEVAAWGKRTVKPPQAWSKFSLSKAEFYYEPHQSESGPTVCRDGNNMDGPADNSMCVDSMWNMRWRARLRRARLPFVGMLSKFTDAINSVSSDLGGSSDLLNPNNLLQDLLGAVGAGSIAPIITQGGLLH